MDDEVHAAFAEPPLQGGMQLQFTLQEIIRRAVGLDVQVDVAAPRRVVRARTEQADPGIRSECADHFLADDGLLFRGQAHTPEYISAAMRTGSRNRSPRPGAARGGGICETDAMAMKKRITVGLVVLAGVAALVWALRPQPVPVSLTTVEAGPFEETVREEGRTRLHETYTVSAPIAGYLHRVALEEGDAVALGDTLLRLEPLPTPALDVRSREQARENLAAARARLQSAEANLENLRAEARFAESEYRRHQELFDRGAVSATEMERMETQRDRARAAVRAGESAVEVARSEVDGARVVLEIASGQMPESEADTLSVRSPAAGMVLQRYRCCEGTIGAGEPVLVVGDLDDLEVQVDLLSMDAVRVAPGMRVRLTGWGGDRELEASVRQVQPFGFTRVSALGVDEQRVPVILDLDAVEARRAGLAVGYRVEAEFVLWEGDAVLQVPTSALFRDRGEWSVFVVEDGRAEVRRVEVGRRSGFTTRILQGLEAGERVVTRPGDRVQAGTRVVEN